MQDIMQYSKLGTKKYSFNCTLHIFPVVDEVFIFILVCAPQTVSFRRFNLFWDIFLIVIIMKLLFGLSEVRVNEILLFIDVKIFNIHITCKYLHYTLFDTSALLYINIFLWLKDFHDVCLLRTLVNFCGVFWEQILELHSN